MGTPARLQAALERLEARRIQLERQIVTELDERFFADTPESIKGLTASHDGSHTTGNNIPTTATVTANDSHITTTWLSV